MVRCRKTHGREQRSEDKGRVECPQNIEGKRKKAYGETGGGLDHEREPRAMGEWANGQWAMGNGQREP